MNAEKLFEKLGYKKTEREGRIDFTRDTEFYDETEVISFYKEYQAVSAGICAPYESSSKLLKIDEINAINKMIEELGWKTIVLV